MRDAGSEPSYAPALLGLLADRGPLAVETLAAELGVSAAELTRELRTRGDVFETADGWHSVVALADGTVFTHLVDADELARGALVGYGDLDLWTRLAEDGLPLAGGSEVRVRYVGDVVPPDAAAALVGPAGWLDGYEPDQLLGLRLVAGALHVEVLETLPTPSTDALRLLVEGAATLAAEDEDADEGPGAMLDTVVLEVLLRDRQAFAQPLPPLTAVLALAGLEVVRGSVGLPGTDWDGTAAGHGLDSDQRHRLGRLRRMLLAAALHTETVDEDLLRDAAIVLAADPDVLSVLAVEVSAPGPLRDGVTAVAAAAETPAGRAAGAYLLATVADADGDVAAAQQRLEAALADAPHLRPALVLAGDYAAERGDAFTADAHYRRAGHEVGMPWRSTLREFLEAPPGGGGRNRPCSCGSGRKTKLCCGTSDLHPLPRRALWRYRRALLFALRAPGNTLLPDLTMALAGPHGDVREVVGDPLVPDLALVEGGLLGRYLAERGTLMPPDERQLVEQWQRTPLALLEVVATRPGRDLTVRALPDGEPVTVRDRALSGDVHSLDLVLGRLLGDGESVAFLAPPRRVPRERRTSVLAALSTGDATAIAAALAPPPPPQLRTREGEEVVLCTARYAVADVDAAWARLADELEEDDDALIELVDIDGDRVLRGRVVRTPDGLEIETNAVERLRRLQGLVRAAASGARLISESTVPAERAMRERGAAGAVASGLPTEVEAQVLAEYAEQAERRWLDEQIPALGGLTPRQAAADPQARPELEALLDDFAWRERESGGVPFMQAARLRDALGLPVAR